MQVFTTEQLINYCKKLKWTRKPKEIHWHHTWKPDHKNFNGNNHLQLQNSMKKYHIEVKKWSDIGQHLTLMPDGKWVTGRDFNRVPASINGRNNLGFSIEMLGNFDKGNDKLEGKQLESAIEFGAFLITFFKLTINDNKFHREYANKSCPGTGINKDWFVNLIKQKLQVTEEENNVTEEVKQILRSCGKIVEKLMNGEPIESQIDWLNKNYEIYKQNGGK